MHCRNVCIRPYFSHITQVWWLVSKQSCSCCNYSILLSCGYVVHLIRRVLYLIHRNFFTISKTFQSDPNFFPGIMNCIGLVTIATNLDKWGAEIDYSAILDAVSVGSYGITAIAAVADMERLWMRKRPEFGSIGARTVWLVFFASWNIWIKTKSYQPRSQN